MKTNDSVNFIKVVCVKADALEYQVREDVNRGNMGDAIDYVKIHYDKHPGCEWKLLPMLY